MQDILIISDCLTTGDQLRNALRTRLVDNSQICTASVDEASIHLPRASLIVLAHKELDQATREFVDYCQAAAPGVPIVVMALPHDNYLVVNYLVLGAAGYVFADDPPEALVDAIQAARRGNLIVDPDTATAIVRQIVDLREQLQRAGYYRFDGGAYKVLTAREREILTLIVHEELTNGDIAERLCIQIGTAKNHVHNILHKLGVGDRGQAVRYFSDSVTDPAT